MAIIESQGCTIKRGNGASPEVFTAIPQVTNIDGPDGTANEIDVSDLDSTAREFIMGLKDEGNVSLSGHYDPDSAILAAMEAQRNNRTVNTYRIELSDSPPTKFTFDAYVTQFSRPIAVDAPVEYSAVLRITGDVIKS